MRKSQASVSLRPAEIPSLHLIWRIPPAYSVVHHEFLAIGRLNPVLCLDAILQVEQIILSKKNVPNTVSFETRCMRKLTIAVCQHAAVKRQTHSMRKPTTACQRANSKVAGPAVYKNIAEFNAIENSSPYTGEDGAD